MHPPPPANLRHLHCRTLSENGRGIPFHGLGGRGHGIRAPLSDHGRARAEHLRVSVHEDARACAHGHACGYAHDCAPSRYEDARAHAYDRDHAHANVCARAFLP
jgi:hypothetical protein